MWNFPSSHSWEQRELFLDESQKEIFPDPKTETPPLVAPALKEKVSEKVTTLMLPEIVKPKKSINTQNEPKSVELWGKPFEYRIEAETKEGEVYPKTFIFKLRPKGGKDYMKFTVRVADYTFNKEKNHVDGTEYYKMPKISAQYIQKTGGPGRKIYGARGEYDAGSNIFSFNYFRDIIKAPPGVDIHNSLIGAICDYIFTEFRPPITDE